MLALPLLLTAPPLRAPAPRMTLEPDLAALARRIEEVQGVEPIKAVVLEAFLPRQALVLSNVQPPFLALLTALEAAGQPIAVLGAQPADRVPGIADGVLRHGVEARIERLVVRADGTGEAVLLGCRLCEIMELAPESPAAAGSAERLAESHNAARYFDARVRFIDLGDSDAFEARGSTGSRAVELAAREMQPLVRAWLDLVRSTNRERSPGQLAETLHELGPMPPLDRPSERALWAAALLNPLPDLGVALDVRPAVLEAHTALSRLQYAKAGLIDSIRRMRSPGPLFDV